MNLKMKGEVSSSRLEWMPGRPESLHLHFSSTQQKMEEDKARAWNRSNIYCDSYDEKWKFSVSLEVTIMYHLNGVAKNSSLVLSRNQEDVNLIIIWRFMLRIHTLEGDAGDSSQILCLDCVSHLILSSANTDWGNTLWKRHSSLFPEP